jgi:hypothetical protein
MSVWLCNYATTMLLWHPWNCDLTNQPLLGPDFVLTGLKRGRHPTTEGTKPMQVNILFRCFFADHVLLLISNVATYISDFWQQPGDGPASFRRCILFMQLRSLAVMMFQPDSLRSWKLMTNLASCFAMYASKLLLFSDSMTWWMRRVESMKTQWCSGY